MITLPELLLQVSEISACSRTLVENRSDGLFESLSTFVTLSYQMIGSCDVVMSVSFKALN